MGETTRARPGWFRDCDFILRRGGVVSGWRLGRGVQMASAVLAVIGLTWTAAATLGAWHFWQEREREASVRVALEWKTHELREATDQQWARLDQLVREVERQRGDAVAMAAAETELRRAIADRESRLLTDTEARIAGIRTRLAEERRDHAAAIAASRAKATSAEEQRDRAVAEALAAKTRLEGERDDARAVAAAAVRDLDARVAAETQAAAARHAAVLIDLEARLGRAEASVADLADRNRSLTQQALQSRGDAHRLQTVVARMIQERSERTDRIAALLRELDTVSHRAETHRAALDLAGRDLARLRGERDALAEERLALRETTRELEDRLVASQLSHQDVMEGLGARAQDRLGAIERVIAATGIDFERMLRPAPAPGLPTLIAPAGTAMPPPLPALRRTGAQGGPFIPPPVETPDANGAGYSRAVIHLDRHIDRLERAERLLTTVPLGAPLGRYALESGFGRRIDPINRHIAMHAGVDLSAPMRTQIRATAGGKVIHAGWMSAYGQTVDIDHGNGLRTRYAHLAAIDVVEGRVVTRGDILGRLGSTGRSTGAHVHYEVIVNGVAVDPMRFMEFARHVRKVQ